TEGREEGDHILAPQILPREDTGASAALHDVHADAKVGGRDLYQSAPHRGACVQPNRHVRRRWRGQGGRVHFFTSPAAAAVGFASSRRSFAYSITRGAAIIPSATTSPRTGGRSAS